MALTRQEKEAVVAEVAEVAKDAHSAVAAEYRGLTVAQMTALRVKAREQGVYVRVVKNTLARIAIAGTEFECMGEKLQGPLVLGFSQSGPSAAARLFRDFAKENDALKAVVVSISGEAMDGSALDKVAKLPTKDEAIASLMSVMQAPVAKLARTLNEVPGKLVRTVDAVRASKAA
ncbi:MAG: 50S ribosomal protein L10 [Gammaproteobacteria bacterium]|nr:50S ribosomal protein L10 [Gammaproteobacteria bacterium]